MSRNVAFLALLASIYGLRPAAAQTSEPKVVERIEVSIANLDVVVVDRHGKPIQGLKPADFEVLEDGVKQEITNFTEYSGPVAGPLQVKPANTSTEGAPARPSRARFIAIIIDVEEIEHVHRAQFFKGIRTFLQKEQRADDQTAIFGWYRRLRALVPPTTNLKAIDATLEYFEKTPRWEERQVAQVLKDVAVAGAEEAGAAHDDPSLAEAEQEFQELVINEERCAYLKRKFEAMRELVASYGSLDLQKVIILASDDLSVHPDKTCDLLANVVSLGAIANSYGFTIHAFHPPGSRNKLVLPPEVGVRLPKTHDPPPDWNSNPRAQEEAEGLSMLARETGGEFAVGAPMSVRSLERVSDTLDNYYSIGYRLAAGRPNQARRVTVRVKDKSWKVRTRRTLVEFSDDRRIADAVVSSLYTDRRPNMAFPIAASVRNLTRSGREMRMKVALTLPLGSLSLMPDGNGNVTGRFMVYFTTGREMGDASPVGHMEQRFVRPASSVGENERVEYEFELSARATTRRVAVAVRDEVSREFGIATIDLTLPK